MVKIVDVMNVMDKIAPRKLAEQWDNPGLLVGSPDNTVRRILVALDATDRVVDKAVDFGADLIVTHHPMIFKPLKHIRTDLPEGAKIQKLIKHDISVFAAHTNLDSAVGGVNDILAEIIGLTEIRPLLSAPDDMPTLGRIGYLKEETDIDKFSKFVKEKLKADYIRIIKGDNRKIKKVALCGGSGAEFISRADFLGADAYITGDVRYHDGEHAQALGIHVIDAGHFATEYPVVKALASIMRNEIALKDIEIIEDTEGRDVFTVV
ncbi:MAG: Nif3-like dinuclear metal center hexameric protein [Selenomonadaceae bacterium]|nr:Nif3-like dinuclear metal center hexameric protein [Selenomonadaceae bacterium]